MKTPVYIISFGDSTKYRFTPEGDSIEKIKEDVKKYLVDKYPGLASLPYYESMTVTRIDEANSAQYASYPEFDDKSLDEIKGILSREVDDAASVRRLNSNDPWGTGADKD